MFRIKQEIIQVYVARNELGDEPFEEYKDFKKMDIGDIVGVKGYPFVTKTGEKSIHATEVTLLSKSLQILPEKHHALQIQTLDTVRDILTYYES